MSEHYKRKPIMDEALVEELAMAAHEVRVWNTDRRLYPEQFDPNHKVGAKMLGAWGKADNRLRVAINAVLGITDWRDD